MVKNFEDMFARFNKMYERDRHPNGQTDVHHIASRGNNTHRSQWNQNLHVDEREKFQTRRIAKAVAVHVREV